MLNWTQIYKFSQIQTGGLSYSDTSPYEVSECSLNARLFCNLGLYSSACIRICLEYDSRVVDYDCRSIKNWPQSLNQIILICIVRGSITQRMTSCFTALDSALFRFIKSKPGNAGDQLFSYSSPYKVIVFSGLSLMANFKYALRS